MPFVTTEHLLYVLLCFPTCARLTFTELRAYGVLTCWTCCYAAVSPLTESNRITRLMTSDMH
eukprot:985239-Amphidinium_carterae.1